MTTLLTVTCSWWRHCSWWHVADDDITHGHVADDDIAHGDLLLLTTLLTMTRCWWRHCSRWPVADEKLMCVCCTCASIASDECMEDANNVFSLYGKQTGYDCIIAKQQWRHPGVCKLWKRLGRHVKHIKGIGGKLFSSSLKYQYRGIESTGSHCQALASVVAPLMLYANLYNVNMTWILELHKHNAAKKKKKKNAANCENTGKCTIDVITRHVFTSALLPADQKQRFDVSTSAVEKQLWRHLALNEN